MAKDKQTKEKPGKGEPKPEPGQQDKGVAPRMMERYAKEAVPALMKKFQYANSMMVPRLEKISVNIGVGEATQDPKLLEAAVRELEAITGQKVVVTKSKKAISNFKLREGLAIGCRVTLRRKKMYEFLDRFISIALPRVRDFRGVPDKSFDGHGNFTFGVKEQIIFPEIDYDKVEKIRGMNISFVTTARTDEECLEMLLAFGMPFKKK